MISIPRCSGASLIRVRLCPSTGSVDARGLSALNMPFLSHLRCSPPLAPTQSTLGFDMKTPGMQDNSPINVMDGTSEPRRSEYSIDGMPLHEPLGLDDYLSWCVTFYRHYPYSCVPCSEFAPGDIFAFA